MRIFWWRNQSNQNHIAYIWANWNCYDQQCWFNTIKHFFSLIPLKSCWCVLLLSVICCCFSIQCLRNMVFPLKTTWAFDLCENIVTKQLIIIDQTIPLFLHQFEIKIVLCHFNSVSSEFIWYLLNKFFFSINCLVLL